MKAAALRFGLAVLLIAAAGLFLQAHGDWEVFPPRTPLASFPKQLGPWAGFDRDIDKETLDVLGHGDFLQRGYELATENQPPIDLFIAYFRSQRAGDTIHSPKNCIPGTGWTEIDSTREILSFPSHVPFPVTRYIVAKGDSRQLVLYWYWAHDRGVASEYLAKYYLVADSMRMHRSDGSLIRISTPMNPGELPASAEQRLLPFAQDVVPLLGTYVPR
jgi:EpsI family protein